jgi:hypothetical protein
MFEATKAAVATVAAGVRQTAGGLATLPVAAAIEGAAAVAVAGKAAAGAVCRAEKAVASAASRSVRFLRRFGAALLRDLADVLDVPAPVATVRPAVLVVADPLTGSVREVNVAVPIPATRALVPVVAAPVAAQAAAVASPKRRAEPAAASGEDELRALIERHGSVRAAARAVGVPESTLRGKLRRAGIVCPRARARK